MSIFPADALAKAEEKVSGGTDYYADLTDEERVEEGLPPREGAKPAEEKPAVEAKPEAEKPKADPDPDDDPDDDDARDERLFNEILGLRKDLSEALEKPEPKTEAKKDELIEAALKHEDPVVRGLAERLQEAEKRETVRAEREQRAAVKAQIEQDDLDFKKVMSSYLIAGKPMTQEHREAVEDYFTEHPELAPVLTIEEATRRVFPDAVKSGAKPSPAKGPGGSSNGKSAPVATIVDEGSAGGAPTGNKKWEPRPNETVESALRVAGERLLGVKR